MREHEGTPAQDGLLCVEVRGFGRGRRGGRRATEEEGVR